MIEFLLICAAINFFLIVGFIRLAYLEMKEMKDKIDNMETRSIQMGIRMYETHLQLKKLQTKRKMTGDV
jgi:hypothetical protein